MRVIDRTPVPARGNYFTKLQKRLQQVLDFGFSWEADQKAQEIIIAQLGRVLNNRFVLIRNVSFEGLDLPIPSILIGPPGLFLLYTSAQKGVFRAKNETWTVMNSRTRNYEPSKPNLINRTLLMSRAVEAHLTRRGYTLSQMQGVIFFTNPGTHVDAIRPVIRIVLMDGLDHYIAGLAQSHTYLTGEEVQTIVDLLTQPAHSTSPEVESETQPDASTATTASTQQPSALQREIPKRVNKITRKIPFSKRQWILLGVFVVVDIIILIAFIILILVTL
jgi:hypothetical protein